MKIKLAVQEFFSILSGKQPLSAELAEIKARLDTIEASQIEMNAKITRAQELISISLMLNPNIRLATSSSASEDLDQLEDSVESISPQRLLN